MKLRSSKLKYTPWYEHEKNNTVKEAIVIGGGISGAATAYSLAYRGYKVRLYEKNNAIACEGSGNYQGLLYGTFHGNYTPLTELHFLGLQYSATLIQNLLQEQIDYAKSGLIQLSADKNKTMRMHESICTNYIQFKENYPTHNHGFTLNKGMTSYCCENNKNCGNYANDVDDKNGHHPRFVPGSTMENGKLKTAARSIDSFLHSNDEICQHVDHNEIEELSGAKTVSQYGLYFPYGMWLHPKKLVEKLASHPNIRAILNIEIDDIELIKKGHTHIWQLRAKNELIDETPNLILCNAHCVERFSPTKHLPLIKTRGQTTTIKAESLTKIPLCDDAYIIPASNGYATLGATFKPGKTDTTIKSEEHQENITAVSNFLPRIKNLVNVSLSSIKDLGNMNIMKDLQQNIKSLYNLNTLNSFSPNIKNVTLNDLLGHAAIRCSSKDYLPIVGPIAEYTSFLSAYKDLSLDKNLKIPNKCPYLPGLFVNVAHGAKGFTTAPICGEIIASYIDNSDFSCSEILRQALHPNRFWLKDIIRGK